jgi:hypothetical protein
MLVEAPPKIVTVSVDSQPNPDQMESPTPAQGPPIHALSALILLVVDNLWNLTEWVVIDWIITIPLSFISVMVPVFLIQKFLKKNSTGKAMAWATVLAVLAAVPFSVLGTVAGSMLLGWLGINKLWGQPTMKRVN